jgi:hypothetical protein
MTMTKDLYALGEMPPLGHVPARMHAQLIRQDRFGEPQKAFRAEVVDVPAELKPDEVLVWVMAAGINYNNVWAGLGSPIDVIAARKKDKDFGDDLPFHIGGSDASGIVWKTGGAVTDLKAGDHVVVHCGMWKAECPTIAAGGDHVQPELHASGATRPTSGASHSSRACRRINACRRRSISPGRPQRPTCWWEPRRIACSTAGRGTPCNRARRC